MKKKAIILISLLVVLSFSACSKSASQVTESVTTPTATTVVDTATDEATEDTAYFYSSTGATAIASTWGEWGTGTTIESDVVDATYSKVIKLTGADSWGTVLAFPGLTAGIFAEYTTLNFKIKSSDFTEVQVKLPEVEKTYQLSSASGTDLGNGWIQMSIPLSDFASVLSTVTEFAIFNNTQHAAGKIMYLTDITLTGKIATTGGTTPPVVIVPTTGTGLLNYNDFTFYTATGSTHAIDSNGVMTYTVNSLGGQWDDQILNEVPVTAEGDYIVKFTASSSVDRDLLFKVDKIGCAGTSGDKVIRLTSTPTEYSINVTGVTGIVGNTGRLKLVVALGDLDGSADVSVPSIVTAKDFYLGLQ